jgi:hypothetical protein
MREALVGLVLLCACGTPANPAAADTASTLDDGERVALRYASLEASGWSVVIEVLDESFEERVSVHYKTASGAWTDAEARFLAGVGDGREIWIAEGLPALEPLELAVHDEAIFSGGTRADYWDNAGGKNYRTGRLRSAMGPGVDVAVTALSVSAEGLAAKLLVRNLAYDKHVALVYTTDDWKTTRNLAATYDHGGQDGGEVWRALVPLDASVTDVKLAAVAQQNATEAWDNDFGRNFECRRAASWVCSGATLVR